MKTELIYNPDQGIIINKIMINWGDNRNKIRDYLNDQHKASDSIIDSSEYNKEPIIQRRDIYQNFNDQTNFFFFNYDQNDHLAEIEIHEGVNVTIKDIKLTFDLILPEVVNKLKSISRNFKELSEGEYIFDDLKLTIADSAFMGGEGDLLAYIHFAKNIDHLAD